MSPLQEEEFFWAAIEQSNSKKNEHWSEYDIDEHLENLTQHLAQFNQDQLVIFEKTLQLKLSELYTAEIAELAIILENDFTLKNGICSFDTYLSDDGFIYFRCWLLLKGKDFFEDMLKDIQLFVSGKYSFDIGNLWGEGLLYVSDEAYIRSHNSDSESPIRDIVFELHPDHHYDFGGAEMLRELYKGDELQKHYPQLVKEICNIRTE